MRPQAALTVWSLCWRPHLKVGHHSWHNLSLNLRVAGYSEEILLWVDGGSISGNVI